MNKMGSAAMLLACVVLNGCSAYNAAKSYVNVNRSSSEVDLQDGPDQVLDRIDFVNRLKKQGDSYKAIKRQLGYEDTMEEHPGMYKNMFYATASILDADCHSYFSGLDRLFQDKGTSTSEASLVGSTTTSLMGAFKASHVAIAAVAALFGLTTQTIDNLANNMLYDLPPYATYALVVKAKQAFIAYLPLDKISNGPQLITALNGYYELCTPIKIRGFVTEAVKSKNASVDVIPGSSLGKDPGFYIPSINFGAGGEASVPQQTNGQTQAVPSSLHPEQAPAQLQTQ
ncbi:hypothetical protein [Nitrospirillum iridis]|uniref:HTH merR-type domain-containing protein n=1 Tax=Nitrospirillum iridis TaxID=765888 RepID=A0A7X0B3K7_9PROT|nr:hypothetical protein [Nitrospirillum iridis]MBB6254351.1 hypothetical protein [Nitrospirillum iridis]